MLTVAVALALWPLASVTVNDSRNVPLVISVTVWGPVPMNGAVPPEAVTSQMKGLPAVRPDVGQETFTIRGCPVIVTLAEPTALAPLASVTVKDSVNVPFVDSLLLKAPSPVYGGVPPVTVTMQLKGLPAV